MLVALGFISVHDIQAWFLLDAYDKINTIVNIIK